MNRYKMLIAITAFSMVLLSLPLVASAQRRGNQNRNNDNYGRNDVNLSYSVKNLRNNSRRFEDVLDRELDRSRLDGTDREDNLNGLAKRFKDAAEDLDDEFEGRGNFNRSSDEARRVLDAGSRLDQALTRSRIGRSSVISSQWGAIERDLLTISRAYNYSYNGTYGRNNGRGNGGYGNGGYGNDDRNGGNGRDNRNLRATIVNLKNAASRFENLVDREYDNDRNNRGRNNRRNNRTDLEDLTDKFKKAVDDLEDKFDNRRDYNRSADEARRVLNLGQQIDREITRARVSRSIRSDWNRIERDLQELANAYNYSYNTNNRGISWPF